VSFVSDPYPFIILQAPAAILKLASELALEVGSVLDVDLEVLDFLGEFDVFLRKAGLVGCDVDHGAVQLLDADVQFVDGHFQLLGVLDGDHLRQHQQLASCASVEPLTNSV